MRVLVIGARRLVLPLLLLFCFVSLFSLALLLPHSSAEGLPAARFGPLSENEERRALLRSFGWETEEEPAEIVQVNIPRKFDAVYEAYNDLQRPLGLDLSRYRGKVARRYTYVVQNHPYNGTVYANLLLCDSQLIAADLCSAESDGFLCGLVARESA